ncbi:Bud site selection protein 6 [Allomyces javanicus]|nr:Bud site selection protein 6 [Allomyces javanicus]
MWSRKRADAATAAHPAPATTKSSSSWLPYVQIPRALVGSMLPVSVATSSAAAAPVPATAPPKMALPAPGPRASIIRRRSSVASIATLRAPTTPADILATSIKRISSAARQLVLAILDVADVSDEHLSALYTAIVKEYFASIDVLDRLAIGTTDIAHFPDDFRAALEHVFAVTAARNQAGPNARRTSALESLETDACADRVDALLQHLLVHLQTKRDEALVKLEDMPDQGAATAATKANRRISGYPTASSKPVRHSMLAMTSTLPPLAESNETAAAPNAVSPLRNASIAEEIAEDAAPPALIEKLFLQLDADVKRVNVRATPPISLAALQALFTHRFNLPVSADFPKIYIKDADGALFYELEDMHDVVDGSLLKLQPLSNSVPVSPLVLPSPAARASPAPPSSVSQRTLSAVLDPAVGLAAVHALRADVAAARDQVSAATTAVGYWIDQVSAALTDVAPAVDAPIPRGLLVATKADLRDRAQHVAEQATDLWETVEQVRLDMVQRAAIPARTTLDYVQTEAANVTGMLAEVAARVDAVTPAWKLVWERELHRVVAEQQVLEGAEVEVDEAAAVLDAVEAMERVLRRVGEGEKVGEAERAALEAIEIVEDEEDGEDHGEEEDEDEDQA